MPILHPSTKILGGSSLLRSRLVALRSVRRFVSIIAMLASLSALIAMGPNRELGPVAAGRVGLAGESPWRWPASAWAGEKAAAERHRASRRRAVAARWRGLRGLDVSHWNHGIHWRRVRASGQRFAILKASEGRRITDPTYARNRRRALKAGLVVAAYHFALPDRHGRDAIIEADHFLKVARMRPGDIVPVLDLETSGDLRRHHLIRWTWRWLREVERRTGVKAMIYTGADRWQHEMRNTQRFAKAGYPLWLAHWTHRKPDVPAHDWGGHGWTFWQHTACGRVPGIRKCVDLDRYRGTELRPVRVTRVLHRPPPPRPEACSIRATASAAASRIARSRSVRRTSRAARGTARPCAGRARTGTRRRSRGPRT
jgi:GH25 family lysozyme M1 (1,4-beta-N-acetylmuramidase)